MALSDWQPQVKLSQLKGCLRDIATSFESKAHSSTQRVKISGRHKLKKIFGRTSLAGDNVQNDGEAVTSKDKHVSRGSTVRFALGGDIEHTAASQRNTTIAPFPENDSKRIGLSQSQLSKLILDLFSDFDQIGEISDLNLSDYSTTSELDSHETPASQSCLRSILKKRLSDSNLLQDDRTTLRPLTPTEDTIDQAIDAKLRMRANLKSLSRTRKDWQDDDKFRGLLEYILNRKRISALQWLYYHPEDIAKHETSSYSRWHKNPWKKPLPASAEKIEWDVDIFKRETARPLLHSYDIGPRDEHSGVPAQAPMPASVSSWAECQGKRQRRTLSSYAAQKAKCMVSRVAYLEPCRRLRYYIGRRIDRKYGEEWPARFRFVRGAQQWACPHPSHGSHIV